MAHRTMLRNAQFLVLPEMTEKEVPQFVGDRSELRCGLMIAVDLHPISSRGRFAVSAFYYADGPLNCGTAGRRLPSSFGTSIPLMISSAPLPVQKMQGSLATARALTTSFPSGPTHRAWTALACGRWLRGVGIEGRDPRKEAAQVRFTGQVVECPEEVPRQDVFNVLPVRAEGADLRSELGLEHGRENRRGYGVVNRARWPG
jgi:hypothetical protein